MREMTLCGFTNYRNKFNVLDGLQFLMIVLFSIQIREYCKLSTFKVITSINSLFAIHLELAIWNLKDPFFRTYIRSESKGQ